MLNSGPVCQLRGANCVRLVERGVEHRSTKYIPFAVLGQASEELMRGYQQPDALRARRDETQPKPDR